MRFANMVDTNTYARDPVDDVAKTLNRGADTEFRETYFTTNGCLEQVVQQNRTTVHTVHNALWQVLKDSFITSQWYVYLCWLCVCVCVCVCVSVCVCACVSV